MGAYRSLIAYCLSLRIIFTTLLLTSSLLLPKWDPSSLSHFPRPLTRWDKALSGFMSWDSEHFLSITQEGYGGGGGDEKKLAFAPGLPGLVRWTAKRVGWETVGVREFVGIAWGWTTIASLLTVLSYYHHLKRLLPSGSRIPYRASLLFLIPPHPTTLHATPYTEPFFALFIFNGLFLFLSLPPCPGWKKWGRVIAGTTCCALATGFRSQGVVVGPGILIWSLLIRDPSSHGNWSTLRAIKNLPAVIGLSLFATCPFLFLQDHGAQLYCPGAEWCSSPFGLQWGWSYSSIQAKYWDVGFLKYWRIKDLPNFLVAAPTLLMTLWSSKRFYEWDRKRNVDLTFPFLPISFRELLYSFVSSRSSSPHSSSTSNSNSISRKEEKKKGNERENTEELLPLIHLSTITTLLLLFTANVQIIQRLTIGNPVVPLFVASLIDDGDSKEREGKEGKEGKGWERKWGRRWVGYCVIWGGVGLVLWACFLPPA